jgi:hypothetical protein
MNPSVRFATVPPTPPAGNTGPSVPPGKPPAFTDADMTHFRLTKTPHPLYVKKTLEWEGGTPHHVWSRAEMEGVKRTHKDTTDIVDKIALGGIKILRIGFDVVSGYLFGRLTKNKVLRRILFLETAAGIPGMVAGSLRHLYSLRYMQRDRGWIHTLLEEAENERMHMIIFMHRHKPGLLFRAGVLITQGVFWNVFFFSYLMSPRLCHRFVGYLEEEAVRTYTHIIDVMDSKDPKDTEIVEFGKSPADEIAIKYWKLPNDATMRDVMLAVRADEANHRDVNHTFAGLRRDEKSPFD